MEIDWALVRLPLDGVVRVTPLPGTPRVQREAEMAVT